MSLHDAHDHDADCIDSSCDAKGGTCCEHCSGWRPLAAQVVARARVVLERWKAEPDATRGLVGVEDALIDSVVELEHALDALDHPDEPRDW